MATHRSTRQSGREAIRAASVLWGKPWVSPAAQRCTAPPAMPVVLGSTRAMRTLRLIWPSTHLAPPLRFFQSDQLLCYCALRLLMLFAVGLLRRSRATLAIPRPMYRSVD